MPTPEPSSLLEFFNPQGLPYALGLLLAVFLGVKGLDKLTERISERFVTRRLQIKKINTLIGFGAYIVAAVAGFSSLFKFSPEAILALSGTIAVTLGFAFKDVAASVMSGISILATKPFQVGDRITFGEYYGEVREIGLRSVRLVTLDDNQVTIPSNKFLTDAVASANAGALDCMVVMPFFITPAADHHRAWEIVNDAVLSSQFLYLGKPVVVLVSNRLGDDARVVIELTAKAYVYDTRYEKAFASDVTDRVLSAFRREGIAVPGAAS